MSNSRTNVDLLKALLISLGGTSTADIDALIAFVDSGDLATTEGLYVSGTEATLNARSLRLTNNAVADDQTIDYYKENVTFNPVVAFNGNSVGLTYGSRDGRYTRFGNLVYFRMEATLTAKGSSTGNASIGPLPFAAASGGTFGGTVEMFGSNLTAGVQSIKGIIPPAGTVITISKGTTGGDSSCTEADLTNTSSIFASGIYMV